MRIKIYAFKILNKYFFIHLINDFRRKTCYFPIVQSHIPMSLKLPK